MSDKIRRDYPNADELQNELKKLADLNIFDEKILDNIHKEVSSYMFKKTGESTVEDPNEIQIIFDDLSNLDPLESVIVKGLLFNPFMRFFKEYMRYCEEESHQDEY